MTRCALSTAVAALLLLVACSSDDDATPGTDARAGDSAAADGAVVDTSSGNDASTDIGSGSDASVTLVTISGVVREVGGDGDAPVSGATITLRDSSPLVQTTTAGDGSFSLQVPANQVLMVEVAKTDLLSSIITFRAPSGGVSEVELGLLLPAAADGVVQALSLPARDTGKGIVIVNFELDDRGGVPAGGEKAVISAGNAGSFVFDDNDDPVLGDTLLAGGGDVAVYFNVAVGTTTVTISGSGCSADLPASTTYPVEANKVSWILAHCGPL